MIREIAVLTVLLMAFGTGEPPIRYVPRVVDRDFAGRMRMCRSAPASHDTIQTNDARLSVAELLGSELLELQVHQIGNGLDFDSAANHIRRLLTRRPRVVSNYSPWAEPTPLAVQGILGSLRYSHGRTGPIEIAGMHLCFQDHAGGFWWTRLADVDVWP